MRYAVRNTLSGAAYLLLLDLGIEVSEFVWHLGVTDGFHPFLGKFGSQAGAAITPPQAFPFFRRHHHQGIAPMLGNDDRIMPCLVAESAEGLLEFTGGDAGCFHEKNLHAQTVGNAFSARQVFLPTGFRRKHFILLASLLISSLAPDLRNRFPEKLALTHGSMVKKLSNMRSKNRPFELAAVRP